VLAGLGTSALAIDGSCSPDTPATALMCRSTYDAAPVGGTLLGLGGVLVLVGSVLALVPVPRPSAREQRPGSAQLQLTQPAP
jgi:hypothetical protein